MTDVTTDLAAAGALRLAGIIDRCLAVSGRRFVPLVVVMALAQVPQWIVTTATAHLTHTSVVIGHWGILRAVSAIAAIVVGVVANTLAGGVVMYAVVQELGGGKFSLRDAMGRLTGRLLPMLGITVTVWIPATLGFFLLLVPGLVLATLYFVAVPACMVEGTGILASLSRSLFLTKGYRWQVVGTVVLMTIVSLIFTAGALFTFRSAAPLADLVIAALLGTFYNVFNGIFYYQLAVAREGVNGNRIASVFD